MSDTGEQSNQQQESKNLRILAYSVKSAIKLNLINQNDEKPIMDCWIEVENAAENIADYETNYSKFRKLICMKFGPRGPNIYDTILKQRTETLRLIDIKQKEKLKQQQKLTQVPTIVNSSQSIQPQQQSHLSINQQQPQQYSSAIYNNYPMQQQQHSISPQPSSNTQYNYQSGGYPSTQHIPPQQGYNQPLYNNNNNIQQQQQQGNQQSNLRMTHTSSTQLSPSPQFMLPVHTQQSSQQQQQQQQMYNPNVLNSNQQPMLYNPNIPQITSQQQQGGGGNSNNLTNRIHGTNNPAINHNQSNYFNQNYNPTNNNAPFNTIDHLNSINAVNNANNANMISNQKGINNNPNNNTNTTIVKNNSNKKTATNKPEKEKKKKLSKKEEAALAALNNNTTITTSTTTTNKLSLTTFNSKSNTVAATTGKNIAKPNSMNNIDSNIISNLIKPIIPLTIEQEIDGITEKVNVIQDGLEVVSDHTIATPLITNQFITNEAETAKQRLRDNIIDQSNKKNSTTSSNILINNNIDNNNEVSQVVALHEEGQAWQYYNIVDKTMLALSSINILEENGLKIDISTLNVLSNGIQIHLKNILESAYKINKAKENKTSITSYEALSRMIIDHGNGNALIENKSNIAMKWGPDIYHLLKEEDAVAKILIAKYNEELENKLSEKMKLYDEEKYKPTNKRKFGIYDSLGLDTTPWWVVEETAEKSGSLSIAEIVLNSFKSNVAKKYEYGNFINKKKIKCKQAPTSDSINIPTTLVASTTIVNTTTTTTTTTDHNSSTEINNSTEMKTSNHNNLNTTTTSIQQFKESELNWKHQPCPLKLPISTNIINDEDIANTISRFAYARTVQGGRNKSSTSAGTSVYKMKMGIYETKQSRL